jgi:uncharacterized protein YhfF
MIFAHTIDRVLDGTKTATLRMAYPGDHLAVNYFGKTNEVRFVLTDSDRVRWRTGKEHAVQRGRGRFSEGRIRITSLHAVDDPREVVDDDFARREGFASADDFLAAWKKLHKNPWRRCWAIGFVLVPESSHAKTSRKN